MVYKTNKNELQLVI